MIVLKSGETKSRKEFNKPVNALTKEGSHLKAFPINGLQSRVINICIKSV